MEEAGKRIGIITHWGSKINYGQQMQAFALQKYLMSIGYEPEIIRWFGERNISLCKRVINLMAKGRFLDAIKERIESRKKEKANTDAKDFDSFCSRHIKYSQNDFLSFEELKDSQCLYDVLVTGSDQVFTTCFDNPESMASYTLDFGGVNTKRIAYAASSVVVDDQKLLELGEAIKKIDFVSFREQYYVNWFSRHFPGKTYEFVPDPVFLLDSQDYIDLIRNENIQEYTTPEIFMYGMGDSQDLRYQILELERLHSFGFTLCSPYKVDGDLSCTIEQWLKCILNAKLFLTSSFHGLCFALIFETPFLYFGKVDTRVETICDMFGVRDRIIALDKLSESLAIPWNHSWNDIFDKISFFSRKGKCFIVKSLEEN